MTIAYYEDNGILTPIPAVRRAVQMARAELEKQGHRVKIISIIAKII